MVNNDTIVNVESIYSVERYPVENEDYNIWHEKFRSLMKDVIEQYMKENIDILMNNNDDDEIVNELYGKFEPIIRRNIEKEYGVMPEQYVYNYIITMNTGKELQTDEKTFNKICELVEC